MVRKIQVTIPPGIDEGTVLRVPRQGAEGEPGGPAGDLFVQVIFEPDDTFRREGRDAYSEVHVPLSVALLGGETRVQTVTGEALLKIPAGTQSGSQFRLRGEGFPRFRGSDRGDLLVTAQVDLPRSLTARQRELLREAFPASSEGSPGARKGGIFSRRS